MFAAELAEGLELVDGDGGVAKEEEGGGGRGEPAEEVADLGGGELTGGGGLPSVVGEVVDHAADLAALVAEGVDDLGLTRVEVGGEHGGEGVELGDVHFHLASFRG